MKTHPTVEEHLAAWAKQVDTCVIRPEEWAFVAGMRHAFRRGVGFGWMQQIIEIEWNAKHGSCAWGPRYFGEQIEKLRAEVLALRAAMNQIIDVSEEGSASDAIQDMLEIAREALDVGDD